MVVSPAPAEETFCDRVLDWYWRHGQARQGIYELRPGGWLDQLYREHALDGSVRRAKLQAKPAFALWGPSQTGKSTLISSYLDANADERGVGSALDWAGGEPARFVRAGNSPPDTLALNPHNQKRDASSCVSRFRLAESVPDPKHPVELRFMAIQQLMHALAMGYLSECNRKLENGTLRNLDEEIIAKKLECLAAQVRAPVVPQRLAYEQLRGLVEVLESLIESGEERYTNLHPRWAAIRRQILESAALTSSMEQADEFAADLLWDGRRGLTDLYRRLSQKANELSKLWGRKPVRCSLRVAALLLDFNTYEYLGQTIEATAGVRESVKRLTYDVRPDGVVIGQDLTHPLVGSHHDDFGLLQGLIQELVIPLRRETLAKNSPHFCNFLAAADLIDFPGVSLAFSRQKESLIDVDQLVDENRSKLFTEVLKRGRTSSIVAAYSKFLSIDGFCLLNRIMDFPAQPQQLATGIFTWLKYFGHEVKQTEHRSASPLPLNLVLTFCAQLVGPLMDHGNNTGLIALFKSIREHLGRLADPEFITHTLATNYAQFRDGRLDGDEALKEKVWKDISNDRGFQSQFVSETSRRSFREAMANGGTDYLFDVLRQQAEQSRRSELLFQRDAQFNRKMQELLNEAIPAEADNDERRKRLLNDWQIQLKKSLSDSTHEDPAAHLSRLLRLVFDVNYSDLETVPNRLGVQREPVVRSHVEKQFSLWIASRKNHREIVDRIPELGLTDTTHLGRVLDYLASAALTPDTVAWVKSNLGTIENADQGRHFRRYLAFRMANDLFSPSHAKASARSAAAHQPEETIRDEIESYADDARPEDSHHYKFFIRPVFDLLDALSTRSLGRKREPQPGDAELLAIRSSDPVFSGTKPSQ